MMRKFIITLMLLLPFIAFCQDSIVTDLQLRARTIKLVASLARASEDTSFVKTFLSWNVQFKSNNPAEWTTLASGVNVDTDGTILDSPFPSASGLTDNANVTIASARTVDVGRMYQYLLSLPTGLNEVEDFAGDFKTSIQPVRTTNSLLDAICDNIENDFNNLLNTLKLTGDQFLRLQ